MSRFFKKIIFFAFLFNAFPIYSQPSVVDSLAKLLQRHTEDDTAKISLLNKLSISTWGSSPQKGFEYAQEALRVAMKLNYLKGIADAYKEISRYYWSQTEYDRSMSFALKALKTYEQGYDSMGISWCYGIIGINYAQGNNYDQSILYQERALALNKKIKNKKGIGRDLNNLGYVFELKKDYDLALTYYQEALSMRIEMRDQAGISISYSNVGSIYLYTRKYEKALEFLWKSHAIAQEIDNKNYIALALQNIGEAEYKMGKYNNGEQHLLDALLIARDIGDKKRKEGVYEVLKNLKESQKDYASALRYMEHLQAIRDTLYTQERSKQMADMSARYETEKKEQAIKLLEQEQRIHAFRQYTLSGGIILVALASVIIYWLQLSRTRKTKQLLYIQQSVNDKLKEVDTLRSRFFTNVSHEFRTPLTLLQIPIEEKLKEKNISHVDKKSLMMMQRNTNRLLDLVNQLLDLSKLEAGKMELRVRLGDLEELMHVMTSSFVSLAESKTINLSDNVDLPTREYWYDTDVVAGILNNLLSNALKFTPALGNVTVTASLETLSPSKVNWVKIQVRDTGKGIPKDEQALLFSPFYQVKNVQDNQIGTGLGLALVKELTNLCGGTLELVSEEEKGTIITVFLPVDKVCFRNDQIDEGLHADKKIISHLSMDLEDAFDLADEEQQEKREDIVLVVEDNADLRNFMAFVLQNDFRVLTAINGQEGLEQAIQQMPSLIISDVMMPVMDGITLAEKIKTDDRTDHIPFILLTAKTDSDSRIEGLKTGADDYLIKPFSSEELLVRIKNLIDLRKRLAAKNRGLITVLPTLTEGISLEEKFLQRARAVVEANMSDFLFGVDTLADEIHLSRTQLFRKMKALTGLSPHEFIKDLRLKKAAELILSKTDTVTQISYTVGFADQSYFTKCFKKQFGVLPSVYASSELAKSTL